jgi:branched-chain amino acid transport system ATP-binding protein
LAAEPGATDTADRVDRATTPALQLTGVSAGYGRITGIQDVDLTVLDGETVALLGSNGAGKSTFLRAVSGMIRPWTGRVLLYGEDVTGRSADRMVRAGMAHVPEGRRILASLSVEENLRLGAFSRRRSGGVQEDLDVVFDRFERLGERRRQKAGLLSGGEQQMLAIGRALMSRPRILLLDEPSLGLAPRVVAEVFALVRGLASEGLTILLVEQNARQALAVADRGYLLTTGSVTLSGAANDLLADPAIIEGYLGGQGGES